MRHRPLILEFIVADAWLPALFLALGIVASWFFLCDFWILRLIPDEQLWTPWWDRNAFLFGAVVILIAEMGIFRLLLKGRGPERRVDLIAPEDRLGASQWAEICRSLREDKSQRPCFRWYMGWQARLLDPCWQRLFRRIAKRSPRTVWVFLAKEQHVYAGDLPRVWRQRPYRWILCLWPVGLCWFLLNSSRPNVWVESMESQKPDIWAADMVREVVANPTTGQRQKQPPQALIKDGTPTHRVFWGVQQDGFPIEVALSVRDWPRSRGYMDVICGSAVSGGPVSCDCATSLLSGAGDNKQPGLCHIPIRGGVSHFAVFRKVDRQNKPIPLRVLVSLLRPVDRLMASAEVILKEK